MKKNLLISFIFLFISTFLFANGTKEIEENYLASTSWTAAFAYVGGLDDVKSVSPIDLTHPPEYEILPSDILNIQNSKAFIFAGYEVMMETLSKNILEDEKKLQIQTINSLANIKKQASVISNKFNTQEISEKRVQEIENLFISAKKSIEEKGINEVPVYVHFHQQAFAKSLGLNVVGVFGPNEITAKNIEDVSKIENVLIIDNIHNQLANPFLEVNKKANIISWRNFPNKDEDKALFNMLKNNIEDLINIY